MGRQFKDITGQKFGKLTVLYRLHNYHKKDGVYWLCVCECGNLVETSYKLLVRGSKKNCTTKIKGRKLIENRLYNIYRGIKSRCYNKHRKFYHRYGGRGINMCDEWLNSYRDFEEWSMANGYDDTLTIDRIDVNGNYEPNNCRWISYKQQNRNRRDNVNFTYNGETHCLVEWCEILGLNYGTVNTRRNKLGWSMEQALELEAR